MLVRERRGEEEAGWMDVGVARRVLEEDDAGGDEEVGVGG